MLTLETTTMPKAALKSMSGPSGATEAKAKHIVRNDNKDKKIAWTVTEKANTAAADHRWQWMKKCK